MAIIGDSFTPLHAFAGSNGQMTPVSIRPFTSLELEKDEEVQSWLVQTSETLADYYSPYRRLYKDNISMYVGGMVGDEVVWDGSNLRYRSKPKVQTNILRPIIEAHVARLTSTRASVSVLPVHSNEYNDLAAAKNAEAAIKMSFDQQKIDQVFENAGRMMLVCGSAYVLTEWDHNIGSPLPQVEKGIPVMDDNGKPRIDEDGRPIMIHPPIRTGDVAYRLLRPDQVISQPVSQGRDPDWVIIVEMEDVYKVREQFPTLAHEIHPSSDGMSQYGVSKKTEKQTLVFRIFHRATPALPHGRYVVSTKDTILENTDLPYPTLNKYGELPISRVHDMEIPGYDQPLPLTVMEAGKPYQNLNARIQHNILRNLSMAAPKWVVNSTSGVRPSHLNNASTIVQYKGAVPPQLTTAKTTANEVFNYRNELNNEMQVVTGASHALNAPPPNTRAAAMLEHQEQQEFQRAEPLIKHMNNFQAQIARVAVSIMADYYSDSDERVIKLAGHGSAGHFMRLQASDLLGPFDVRFERSSALPDGKQGRLNEAARLFQLGLISPEQYKQVIGFSGDPELASAETKAFEKQLLENDLMIRGQPVEAPQEWEDHVEHLKALYPIVQSVEFTEFPTEIQEAIKLHALAHEMLAWQRAQVSLVYALKVTEHVPWLFFSALPEAFPVQAGQASTPAESIAAERLTTPGLIQPSSGVNPGPENPELV